jgi:hypothetical protein
MRVVTQSGHERGRAGRPKARRSSGSAIAAEAFMNNVGWVRCGNASTSVIERVLRDRHTDLIQFSTNAEGALLIIE